MGGRRAFTLGPEPLPLPKKPKRPRPSPETFGSRLRRLRKAKGLTQTELGARAGVSQRVVTYYEREGGSPSLELVVKFSEALGVSSEVLLGVKGGAEPREAASPVSLRLLRRLKRLEELPAHDQKAVLRMIDALAVARRRRE